MRYALSRLTARGFKLDKAYIIGLMNDLKAMKDESLRLPLPRRADLDPVRIIKQMMFDPYWAFVSEIASLQMYSETAIARLCVIPEFKQMMDERGISSGGMISNMMVLRHQMSGAPIMTLTKGLSDMLADTNISDDVPCKFFTAPMKTVYIEFDPAERRHLGQFKVIGDGLPAICEGCYVQETIFPKLPRMVARAKEILDLDPNKPVRIIEVGFSASPLNNPNLDHEMPVSSDTIDFATIYIQDEDEPIKEVLERHFTYYRSRIMRNENLDPNLAVEFEKQFSRNFSMLTKVFFYLYIDRKEQVKVTDATDLEKRLNQVADKKKDKIRRQLNRVYDHILIGPKTYIPVSQRISSDGVAKGSVSPHYRRATIGIRWVGSGAAKEAKLVRIKESVVNQHLINKAPDKAPARKNYVIR